MKILQVNNVYGEKSTGKITKELHEGLLQAGHESLVVYGRGNTIKGSGVIRLCPDWYGKANSLLARITGIAHGGCLLSTWRLQRIILREKPDVVHLQCINEHFVNIYRLVDWLKKHRIKTVVSLHAEFMYTANCGHAFDCEQWMHGCQVCPCRKKAVKSWFFDRTAVSWKRMKEAFLGFENNCVICPVSPWTEKRARQSDILSCFSFRTVSNGVNTNIFRKKAEKAERLEVVHVTACFSAEKCHPKGGWYLIQLAERMKDVTFLVAGRADLDLQLPDNVVLLGEVKDQEELAALYGRSRISLLLSRRETFSMPCAESLCCGTAVAGFRAGAPEQISMLEYSEFVEYGDLDALENTLRRWLNRRDLDTGKIAYEACKRYSVETMVKNFIEIYGRLLWN